MESEKKKKLGGLSKAIYILAAIGKVFTVIGMACILVVMVVVPLITSNIKVNKDTSTIKVFGEDVKYERTDSEIKLTIDNHTEKISDKVQVTGTNFVIDYLEENNLNKVTVIAEVLFVFAFASLVLVFIELKNLNKLFKNIYKEDSPFNDENTNYIKKIAKVMLYILVLSFVANVVLGVLSNDKVSFNLDGSNIIHILIAFSLYYIFDYGNKLQQKAK